VYRTLAAVTRVEKASSHSHMSTEERDRSRAFGGDAGGQGRAA